MERMTVKRKDGRWAITNNDGETPVEQVFKLPQVINRLAAYEDTGLEPEEIERILDAYGRGMTLRTESAERLQIIRDIKTDHLKELVQAEKDGRLVVLPCKVGDTAWVKDRAGIPREMRLEAPDIRFVCTDEDNLCMSLCNRTLDGFCAYRIKNDGSDIGTKIFLTREEAEAALTETEESK